MPDPSPEALAEARRVILSGCEDAGIELMVAAPALIDECVAAVARALDERDARIAELEAEVKIKDEIHRMDEIAYSEMEAELTAANARITALEAEVICQNKLKSRVMELEAEVAYREESKVNQLLVTDLPVKALDRIRSLIAQQAEDLALWYTNPRTAPEVYLQQELRRLHALIEEGLG